ncbi:hypothetical protein [Martelella endophytica]|uniref:hypothetical protein n=1 Tax=Martelella endophytica TaxID=1486262 RepID=UPI00130E6708|nr:hypothetical protein [Martelella endophytica]
MRRSCHLNWNAELPVVQLSIENTKLPTATNPTTTDEMAKVILLTKGVGWKHRVHRPVP